MAGGGDMSCPHVQARDRNIEWGGWWPRPHIMSMRKSMVLMADSRNVTLAKERYFPWMLSQNEPTVALV